MERGNELCVAQINKLETDVPDIHTLDIIDIPSSQGNSTIAGYRNRGIDFFLQVFFGWEFQLKHSFDRGGLHVFSQWALKNIYRVASTPGKSWNSLKLLEMDFTPGKTPGKLRKLEKLLETPGITFFTTP